MVVSNDPYVLPSVLKRSPSVGVIQWHVKFEVKGDIFPGFRQQGIAYVADNSETNKKKSN